MIDAIQVSAGPRECRGMSMRPVIAITWAAATLTLAACAPTGEPPPPVGPAATSADALAGTTVTAQ